MKHSVGNTITAILIAGEQYTIINRLFKSSVMRGYTTQCWLVHGKDSIKYIIKDSWINSRQVNKIEILCQLTGVENVSTLVKGWDLTLPDGKMDTTGLHWLEDYSGEQRIHQQLLIAEVGMPLSSFCLKKELVGTFLDVVESEKSLLLQILWANVAK